jgi:hypothetical protein
MWKNIVETGRPQTILRMRIACSITKATDTYSEYVIIIAFPQQKWLREHVSMLRLYVHCLSCYRQKIIRGRAGVLGTRLYMRAFFQARSQNC